MRRRSFVTGFMVALAPGRAMAQQTPANPQGGNTAGRPQSLENPIVPVNDLERTFVAAYSDESMRAVFRRQLLDSSVLLALANSAPDSPPLERPLPNSQRMTFIFTSAVRANTVMGPAAPRRVMSGRSALERLRGKYLIINAGLEPMLTLEPDDINALLAMPRSGGGSAGPTQ